MIKQLHSKTNLAFHTFIFLFLWASFTSSIQAQSSIPEETTFKETILQYGNGILTLVIYSQDVKICVTDLDKAKVLYAANRKWLDGKYFHTLSVATGPGHYRVEILDRGTGLLEIIDFNTIQRPVVPSGLEFRI